MREMGSSGRPVDSKSLRDVCVSGVVLLLIFLIIYWLSGSFAYGSELSRPTVVVVLLLLVATGVAFRGLGAAILVEDRRKLLVVIVSVGVSMRLISLFACPILEIDYYRYIWDGKVFAAGVSPYQYSPNQILQSTLDVDVARDDSDYKKLVMLSVKSESNHVILERIHFENYSSIYPPVSQAVFALAMKWFPHSASVEAHILFIKSVLVVFDLLVLGIVFLLLQQLNFHPGWLIVYAWNPLVIKEIANGGHLDSIAVFFLMLSVYLLFRWGQSPNGKLSSWPPILSAIALGFGVGAKLFPAVLFPALLVAVARIQWSKAVIFSAVFVATTVLLMFPMYRSVSQSQQLPGDVAVAGEEDVSLEKKDGLTGFLSTWRMNDVIFSGIYLNLGASAKRKTKLPWYVVTSNEFRQSVMGWCERMSFGGTNPAFALTRVLTLGLFSAFYLFQLVAIYRHPPHGESTQMCSMLMERLGWTMALFLFLQPTVNPWYWVWVAPITVFSKNRSWLIISGLLLIYYSRFWFESLPDSFELAGYSGVGLFHHGVVWLEFAAIFGVMAGFRSTVKMVDG